MDPLTKFVFYKNDGAIYIIGAQTENGLSYVTDEELSVIEKHGWIHEPCSVKSAIED
jgi:hypothetical protein